METSVTRGIRNIVGKSNLRWWKTSSCPFISVTVWVRYCSRSFPPLPVQHVRSAVVPTNRHQSHWLRNHSLPISPLLWRQLHGLVSQIYSSMCSASKDVYLYTVATQTHTCTHTQIKLHWILLSLLPEPKRSPAEFVVGVGCWIHTDRIHLMSSVLPELTIFIRALRAQQPAYPQPDDWMETVHEPFGGDLGLIRWFISELIVSFP